jgi:hypothetical protein
MQLDFIPHYIKAIANFLPSIFLELRTSRAMNNSKTSTLLVQVQFGSLQLVSQGGTQKLCIQQNTNLHSISPPLAFSPLDLRELQKLSVSSIEQVTL